MNQQELYNLGKGICNTSPKFVVAKASTGARGRDGATGAQGIQGLTGPQGPQGNPGAGGGGYTNEETLIVTSDGQTVFTISMAPDLTNQPILFINGQSADFNVDYTIVGTTLTWISGDFSLATTDDVILYYSN